MLCHAEAQSGRVLDTILDVIKNSDSKSACNLAVWCIAIQQLRLAIGRKLPDVLAALSQLIGTNQSRFGSSTIEYESISAYGRPPLVPAVLGLLGISSACVQANSSHRFPSR